MCHCCLSLFHFSDMDVQMCLFSPPFTEFAPPEVYYEEPVRAVRTIAAQIAL